MQLFDLKQDPWERFNLAWDARVSDERARLEEALVMWQREVGDPAATLFEAAR